MKNNFYDPQQLPNGEVNITLQEKRKRIFLVTPDIFKYEEEFVIFATDLNDLLEQLQKIECNTVYAIMEKIPYCMRFVGLFEIAEGEPPKYLGSSIQIHDGEDHQ